MNIYKLYNRSNNYKSILYEGTPLMELIGDDKSKDISKVKSYNYTWISDDSKSISDCPFLIGCIPIFKKNIIKNIYFPKDIVDIIPINVDDEEYCIIRATRLVKGKLNLRKSKINKFSDGRVMSIDEYVFNPSESYPWIFRLEEHPLFTFITDDLAVKLSSMNIHDLGIEKCLVKRNWFRQ